MRLGGLKTSRSAILFCFMSSQRSSNHEVGKSLAFILETFTRLPLRFSSYTVTWGYSREQLWQAFSSAERNCGENKVFKG